MDEKVAGNWLTPVTSEIRSAKGHIECLMGEANRKSSGSPGINGLTALASAPDEFDRFKKR